MKAPLTDADRARRSIVFGSHQGERPHSLTREMQDLRSDIEEAFVSLEGGDQLPAIHSVVHDRTNFTVAGNGGLVQVKDLVVAGANFLAGRARASAKIFATGSTDNFITLTSIRPGSAGNSLAVEIVSAGGDNGLSAAIANGKLTISLACAGGNIVDGAANALSAIVAAINNEIDDDFLAVSASGDDTDRITAVVASANLSGGTGEGFSLFAAQPGQDDKELKLSDLTDTSITAQQQDLSAVGVIGQNIGIYITSHTGKSNICFLPVLS